MSYSILYIRHSAEGVIGNTSTTTQYDGPMVAAAAIPGGHFVRFNPALRCVPPPGLPLPAPSTKPPGVSARAGIQSGVHGQSAVPVNSSPASSLPPTAPTDQPGGGSGIRTVVGTNLWPWLRATSTVSSNASFNAIRIAAPQPSWSRFTNCWRRRKRILDSH